MDIKKLALLATFAFVITGIVVYQVRNTRGSSVSAVAVGSSAAPAAPAPETPQTSLPAVSNAAEVKGEAPKPAVESQVLSIPPDGWGRSPFLTVEEFAKLHEPAAPTPVIAPVAPPPPVVEALPQHEFSGSIKSVGNWLAFINGRTYRVGDRVGKEVVTEITEDAVTLEFEGKSRKLSKAKPRA